MRAGRFVGRVGGLAVALGVGVAVASSPAVAWAEDGSSPGADSAPPSSTTTEKTAGASMTTETTDTSSVADPHTKGGSTPSDSVDSSAPDASASGGASVRQAAPGTAMSTGGADSSTKRGSKKLQQQDDSTHAQKVDVDAQTSTGTTGSRAISDVEEPQPAPQKGVVAAQAISVDQPEPTEPSGTLTAVELASSKGADPLAPVDAPLELTLLAAMLAVVNSAPNVPQQPVGTPNPTTGVVTGTVLATDPENDPLTYAVAGGPSKGTVALNAQTGAYTYTPTQAARVAAGATPTADTDSFTVAVGDGQQSTTAVVSVYISPIRFDSQAPIAVGTNPSGVVLGSDGRMYVLNTGGKSVSVINTITGQRIDASSSWFSKDISVGSSPSALALSADGKRLYVANAGSGSVSVIDTTNYKRIDANPSWSSKDIKVGSSPSALAFGADGRLYVANGGNGTVSVIDTATNKLIDINPNVSGTQAITVGSSPSALVLNGSQLYVANRGSNTVSVINTNNYSVTTTIAVGSQPSAVALGAGGRLYVANTGSATVSVINTVTNTVGISPVSVGPSPSSVAFNPTGSLAYVANSNDTVSVIDTATYTVLRTVTIDTDATGGHVIAVSPNGTVYVTDAVDKTVRVLAVGYGNTAPISGTPTVGTPNSGNGAVTGQLNFTDADGDTLSYSLTQPSAGTVSITSTGVYAFTPTVAARQAAATGGPTNTTFTVKATDGQAIASVSVTVPIAAPVDATRVTNIGSVTVTGYQLGPGPMLTPDGTRALITTYVPTATGTTTRIAVLNTATGKQIGATVAIAGSPSSPVLSPDGTRALITTSTPDSTSGIDTTRITVINTMTGTQIGTTLAVSGSPAGIELLGTAGKRALILTDAYNVYDWDGTVTHATGVAVIDTATGAQTGTTLTLDGGPLETSVSVDGAKARITTVAGSSARVTVIDTTTGTTLPTDAFPSDEPPMNAGGGRVATTTTVTDPTTGAESTRVAVIDSNTGTQIGTAFTLAGGSPATFRANDTRAVITTIEGTSYTSFTTHVAVVNTVAGGQIGDTLTLAGAGSTLLSADGSRVLITTSGRDANNRDIARVAVINTATGAQTFAPLTLTGQSEFGSKLVSTDGSRALLVTNVYDGRISVNTTRLTMIDTTTGAQIGTTTTLTGFLNGGVLFNADTQRAVVTTISSNFATTGKATTQVAVINTATGAQVGTTRTFDDDTGYALLSADGTRALINTGPQLAVINTATGTQAGPTITGGGYALLTADGTRALITTGNNPTKVSVLQIA